jgi:hypothetical protein
MEGVFNGTELDFAVYATEHLPVGVFDGDFSVDTCVYDYPASGIVGMAWDERTPCSFKLVLPPDFPPVAEGSQERLNYPGRISSVIGRFKPAGIRAYVDTAREAWVMGQGVLRDAASTEGTGIGANSTTVRGLMSEGFVPIEGSA